MEEEVGPIVIKLDEIMTNPNSEFNFIVKNGDEIFIPKISEFVTIKGATRVREVVSEDAIEVGNEYPKVLQGSTITVGYKTEEQEEQEKKTDVDWTQLLGDSVSQAMSILTLILLISRLDD
jgi:hypothetical protein